MEVCGSIYVSMQACKYKVIKVYAKMQVCKYTSPQVRKYASMQLCKLKVDLRLISVKSYAYITHISAIYQANFRHTSVIFAYLPTILALLYLLSSTILCLFMFAIIMIFS